MEIFGANISFFQKEALKLQFISKERLQIVRIKKTKIYN
jgi:hypothetical protein